MDSITQFALGGAVSALLLGKKIGPRKAALIGGLLGTLPDLDVLIPYETPVDEFVFHRGWTHSFFVQAFAAPLFGEVLMRLFDGLRQIRWRTYLAVFAVFVTHSLIDAITVYGTRIFWPIYPEPIGIGSMFIVDPLYTLPILAMVVWALFQREATLRFRKSLQIALGITTAYMGLSLFLQQVAESRAQGIFAQAGISVDKIIATAGPANIILWRVIGLSQDEYHNVYISLLDDVPDAQIYSHPRQPDLTECLEGNDAFEKIRWFSRGFYRAEIEDDLIVVSDLRMGLTPNYVFRFAIARRGDSKVEAIMPIPVESEIARLSEDWDWFRARISGRAAVRDAEFRLATEVASHNIATC